MDELYTQFDPVFFEKTRLSMMTVLYKEGTVTFNRLKKIIGGTDGAVYTHVNKLLTAGYVAQKKEIAGNNVQTVYWLTESGKELFRKYLEFLENIIAQSKGGSGNGEK